MFVWSDNVRPYVNIHQFEIHTGARSHHSTNVWKCIEIPKNPFDSSINMGLHAETCEITIFIYNLLLYLPEDFVHCSYCCWCCCLYRINFDRFSHWQWIYKWPAVIQYLITIIKWNGSMSIGCCFFYSFCEPYRIVILQSFTVFSTHFFLSFVSASNLLHRIVLLIFGRLVLVRQIFGQLNTLRINKLMQAHSYIWLCLSQCKKVIKYF